MVVHETITLKEHFEKILIEKDRALSAALAAAKEAVQVAEKNSEKWRDNANEWRSAMSDREKRFIERNEFVAYKDATDKTIDELKAQKNKGEGLKDGWAYALGIIALIATILNIVNMIK